MYFLIFRYPSHFTRKRWTQVVPFFSLLPGDLSAKGLIPVVVNTSNHLKKIHEEDFSASSATVHVKMSQ